MSQEESKEEDGLDETKEPEDEFVLDEIAWKKVKGEVFKKPKCSMLLSIFIGIGMQIIAMTFLVLIFALIGIISPYHRGTLISTLYFCMILLSNLSGFYSARFYKMF